MFSTCFLFSIFWIHLQPIEMLASNKVFHFQNSKPLHYATHKRAFVVEKSFHTRNLDKDIQFLKSNTRKDSPQKWPFGKMFYNTELKEQAFTWSKSDLNERKRMIWRRCLTSTRNAFRKSKGNSQEEWI